MRPAACTDVDTGVMSLVDSHTFSADRRTVLVAHCVKTRAIDGGCDTWFLVETAGAAIKIVIDGPTCRFCNPRTDGSPSSRQEAGADRDVRQREVVRRRYVVRPSGDRRLSEPTYEPGRKKRRDDGVAAERLASRLTDWYADSARTRRSDAQARPAFSTIEAARALRPAQRPEADYGSPAAPASPGVRAPQEAYRSGGATDEAGRNAGDRVALARSAAEVMAWLADLLDLACDKAARGAARVVELVLEISGVPDDIAALIGEAAGRTLAHHFLTPVRTAATAVRIGSLATWVLAEQPILDCPALPPLIRTAWEELEGYAEGVAGDLVFGWFAEQLDRARENFAFRVGEDFAVRLGVDLVRSPDAESALAPGDYHTYVPASSVSEPASVTTLADGSPPVEAGGSPIESDVAGERIGAAVAGDPGELRYEDQVAVGPESEPIEAGVAVEQVVDRAAEYDAARPDGEPSNDPGEEARHVREPAPAGLREAIENEPPPPVPPPRPPVSSKHPAPDFAADLNDFGF